MHRKALVVSALLLAVVACGGNTTTTTDTAPSTTTTSLPPVGSTTTSESVSTTTTTGTTTPEKDDGTVLLHPFADMGANWSELFLPYGEGEDSLGTSPGGDAGSVLWGPDYGTQTPDGSWWFLDAAKLRIAHFSADGEYLDQTVMPEDLLVDGRYFQYQMPQALDDGTVVMSGYDRPLVRIAEDSITATSVANAVPWHTTDGTMLYGFSLEDSSPVRLDPATDAIEETEWFMTRNGARYRVSRTEEDLVVELPDSGVTRTLRLRYSEDPEVIAFAGFEVDTGADGSLFLLFYGAPESDETLGVGGFVSIAPDGTVTESEVIRDPFSPSDPGSPARLGVTPGTSTPWLMFIDEDGVRVFTATG